MTIAVELITEPEFEQLMHMIARGSSRPITDVELFKRWLAIGLAHDAMKPQEQAAVMIERFLHVNKK